MQLGTGFKSPLPQFAAVHLVRSFWIFTAALASVNDLSSPPSNIPDPAYKRLPTGMGATPTASFRRPFFCSDEEILFWLPLWFSDKKIGIDIVFSRSGIFWKFLDIWSGGKRWSLVCTNWRSMPFYRILTDWFARTWGDGLTRQTNGNACKQKN